MPGRKRTKVGEKCILKNIKNKKEDEERVRYLQSMGQKAALPRAPKESVSRDNRRKKRLREINNSDGDNVDETCSITEETEDHNDGAEQNVAAAADIDEGSSNSKIKRRNSSKRRKKTLDDMAVVPVRGAVKTVSVLGVEEEECNFSVPFVEYRAPTDICREKNVQHRIKTMLANLSKANRDKSLPSASSLMVSFTRKTGSNGSKKRLASSGFVNIGAEIVKVCLSQEVWSIIHRQDVNNALAQWESKSNIMTAAIDKGSPDTVKLVMQEAGDSQIKAALRERKYFEELADICNKLFHTKILPNKFFDRYFRTVTTDNSNLTVRSFSIPKYFRALSSVWQKLSDVMDLIITGGPGNSGEHSSILRLEECAASVIARAKSRPVEAVIRKAVDQANKAHNLSTGVFKPEKSQRSRQQQHIQLPYGQISNNPFYSHGYFNPYYINQCYPPQASYYPPYCQQQQQQWMFGQPPPLILSQPQPPPPPPPPPPPTPPTSVPVVTPAPILTRQPSAVPTAPLPGSTPPLPAAVGAATTISSLISPVDEDNDVRQLLRPPTPGNSLNFDSPSTSHAHEDEGVRQLLRPPTPGNSLNFDSPSTSHAHEDEGVRQLLNTSHEEIEARKWFFNYQGQLNLNPAVDVDRDESLEGYMYDEYY